MSFLRSHLQLKSSKLGRISIMVLQKNLWCLGFFWSPVGSQKNSHPSLMHVEAKARTSGDSSPGRCMVQIPQVGDLEILYRKNMEWKMRRLMVISCGDMVWNMDEISIFVSFFTECLLEFLVCQYHGCKGYSSKLCKLHTCSGAELSCGEMVCHGWNLNVCVIFHWVFVGIFGLSISWMQRLQLQAMQATHLLRSGIIMRWNGMSWMKSQYLYHFSLSVCWNFWFVNILDAKATAPSYASHTPAQERFKSKENTLQVNYITYPTQREKENHLQTWLGWGYLSCQDEHQHFDEIFVDRICFLKPRKKPDWMLLHRGFALPAHWCESWWSNLGRGGGNSAAISQNQVIYNDIYNI